MQPTQAAPKSLFAALSETRARTLALVDQIDEADFIRAITPLLSPLVWDVGHIANFEQRWLLGDSDANLATMFDPFRQSRAARGTLSLPRREQCLDYMAAVRSRVEQGFDELDRFKVELVIQHEQQHNETMLQLLRMLDNYQPPSISSVGAGKSNATGEVSGGWVEIAAGRYLIGSDPGSDDEFIYDNQKDAHFVDLPEFAIARLPVSNGEFREWVDHGGYTRREWWCDDGWNWLNQEQATGPLSWLQDGDGEIVERVVGGTRPLDPACPVIHVSWFEACAYARAHAARLPSEFEWEVAAAVNPGSAQRSINPWGNQAWHPARANLDHASFGTLPIGHLEGQSSSGCLDMVGQAWEWTESEFSAYPGFMPFCYDQYSQPFFDSGHRVLRGGSWATRARSVDVRFRNWDLPQRRQIFAGFRLARS